MKFTQLFIVAAMALTAAASPADLFNRGNTCAAQGHRCYNDAQCCRTNGSRGSQYLTCDKNSGTCKRLANWSCSSNNDCCTGTTCQRWGSGYYCRPKSSSPTPQHKECSGHNLGKCSYGVCCWSSSLNSYTCSTLPGAKTGYYCPAPQCGGSNVGTCPSGKTCCKSFSIGDRWTYSCSDDRRATYGGTCPSGSGPGAVCSPEHEGVCSTGVCCKVLSIGDKYTWKCSTENGAYQGGTCPGGSRWT